MKRYFLIDSENVGYSFLDGVDLLTDEDKIILFIHQRNLSIDKAISNILNAGRAKTQIINLNAHTKNAMDFQICTCLGALVMEHGDKAEYYIVSRDKGFKSCKEYIKNAYGSKIKLIQCKSCKVSSGKSDILTCALADYQKESSVIKEGLISTDGINEFHTYLQKKLKNKGPAIYTLVKPIYKEVRRQAVCTSKTA